MPVIQLTTDNPKTMSFPMQCECGHIFLEKYRFTTPNKFGEVGFCWCGFCRNKFMIKPISEADNVQRNIM